MKERGETIQQPEDPRKPMNSAIVKILESYNSLCMDDPTDRQRLADVLTEAMWEVEWRQENGFDEKFENISGEYEPGDLYGL